LRGCFYVLQGAHRRQASSCQGGQRSKMKNTPQDWDNFQVYWLYMLLIFFTVFDLKILHSQGEVYAENILYRGQP
jgi:hypothetical protein